MSLLYERHGDVMEVFDAHSQTMLELYEALFDPKTGDLKDSVSEETSGQDILIVQSIEVLPAYRGNSLGLKALRRTMDFLADGCALTALQAYPIQYDQSLNKTWTQQMRPSQFMRNKASAARKLRKYWSQLGFKRIGRTNFMSFDMAYKINDALCDRSIEVTI